MCVFLIRPRQQTNGVMPEKRATTLPSDIQNLYVQWEGRREHSGDGGIHMYIHMRLKI